MSDNDRLERLEQRVMRLEALVRQLVHALPRPLDEPAAPIAADPPAPTPPPVVPRPLFEEKSASEPAEVSKGSFTFEPLKRSGLDGEQWVGQRGLLAVGVAAVVLAAGYLIKLSFDRGWVSPATRCITSAITGLLVAFGGWRIERRGYRMYGTALVGTGAAIVYVAIWAASRLYGFLPTTTGILTMAVVALALAAAAWVLDAEPLGAAASVGAFFAPVIIGAPNADADRLLAYLAAIGLALGAVAWSKHWRLTTLLIGLSYFGLGVMATEHATPLVALVFGAAGGGAGLALGLKYDWWETRFLSFWGGWACLAYASNERLAPLVLIAGLALSYPIFEFAYFHDWTWPFEHPAEGRRPVLQSIYFYVTPFWLVWAVSELKLDAMTAHEGLATAIVAVVYLLVSLTGPRRPFALVGALAATLAILLEWHDSLTAAGALGILTIAFGAHARVGARRDWNYLALLPLAASFWLLWLGALTHRPYDAPAFTDSWARVWWGLIAVTVALATDLAAPEAPEERDQRRGALWGTAGALLWLGATGEFTRLFRQQIADPAVASLAGGLAVSVWWLLFAGACVWIGFRRSLRPLRLAGLWVAGLAVLKVIFVDLSTLDALYRVASVFGLGLVSLLVAWAYHRRARAGSPDVPADR